MDWKRDIQGLLAPALGGDIPAAEAAQGMSESVNYEFEVPANKVSDVLQILDHNPPPGAAQFTVSHVHRIRVTKRTQDRVT